MPEEFNTISEVRRGVDVHIPTLTSNDSFVLVKVNEDGGAGVTLVGLTPQEAIDALMGVVMAING